MTSQFSQPRAKTNNSLAEEELDLRQFRAEHIEFMPQGTDMEADSSGMPNILNESREGDEKKEPKQERALHSKSLMETQRPAQKLDDRAKTAKGKVDRTTKLRPDKTGVTAKHISGSIDQGYISERSVVIPRNKDD